MSKKIIRKTKTVVREEHWCDMCQTEKATHQCYICGKDLCGWMAKGCGIKVMDEAYETDYPHYICADCQRIGRKYESQIEELEEQIDQIKDQWEEEAKAYWILKEGENNECNLQKKKETNDHIR